MTEAAGPAVSFYLDFGCPYSYRAAARIGPLRSRRGARLLWKPIRLEPILRAWSRPPLRERPGEGAHADEDLRRWAEHLGLPLAFPLPWEVDAASAARGFAAARAAGLEEAYCRALLEVRWGRGLDVGRPEIIAEAASAAGIAREALLGALARPEGEALVGAQREEAIARGVYGTPTFTLGGALYYGNDRLVLLEEALVRATATTAAEPGTSPVATTAFNRWFGIRRIAREGGFTRCELEVTAELLNQRGVAHGGVVTSLLDTAMGAAVVSAIARQEWCATLQLSVQFREPVRPGRILGQGRVTKRGRHAAFAVGEVLDPTGRELASAHGVWYIWPTRPPT